jgi:hypothetical protein
VNSFFSENYSEARQKFRAATKEAGAELFSLPLPARGPANEDLTIDIAHLGPKDFTKLFLHMSGIHGVEGFAGSAIQLATLKQPPALPPDTAAVFVHALNPFGMSWLRRVNEHNVDLNRNFLRDGEKYSGLNPTYSGLSSFLNPPDELKSYWPSLIMNLLRHGFDDAKRAVAEGQYDLPQGLFFGGRHLEDGPRLFKAWAKPYLSRAARVAVLDVHTGLGRFGTETLFYHGPNPVPKIGRVIAPLSSLTGYKVRGGLENFTAEVFAGKEWIHFTEEFGTYSMLEALRVLRAENWSFGKNPKVGPWQNKLLRTMYPADRSWRERVLILGQQTLRGCLKWLAATP